MQPIDPNTLFSIFEQGDEEVYREHNMEDALNNPFVLMGMVVRGVQNYHMMDMMYLQRYPKEYKNVRHITKLKYFNNLLKYLKRVESDNFDKIYKIGESFEKDEAFNALDLMRVFYENIEHYEKCVIVKRYQDLLKQKVGELV